jgi:uncharacterized protein YjbJ (UPF0337 family)
MNFKFIRSISIALLLAVALTFGHAIDVFAQPINLGFSQLLATNTFEGTAEKVEGKIQETFANLKGDRENQVRGKVKQAEGAIRSAPGMKSEAEIRDQTKQVEGNVRKYQTDDRQAGDIKDALD